MEVNAEQANVGDTAVDLSGIHKRYGNGPYVVQDLSFSLAKGEFLTLLGPSGCGKTSTLMMVAGFETPDQGTIAVNGRNIAGFSPDHRNFGVVFQGYALFPHMTVQENVEFALRMRRRPDEECRRRALAMLEKVGLIGMAGRRPRELSGGQQQRVAIARALVFEPDALLLDEPLGALDRRLRETMQLEIKSIQKRTGISILFVTHDQDEAMMMSDRIAVMDKGRIVQLDTPSNVYRHPTTGFVASFLGETNLFEVDEFEKRGAEARLTFNGGLVTHAHLHRFDEIKKPRISLRPERIKILRPDKSSGTAVNARVLESTFLGRHTRTIVQVNDARIVVSTSDSSLFEHLKPEGLVKIDWGLDDVQVVEGD